MGQYAGFFGNQNTIGAVSAFLTPYVLFHLAGSGDQPLAEAARSWTARIDPDRSLALRLAERDSLYSLDHRHLLLCGQPAEPTENPDRLGRSMLATFFFFPSLQTDLIRFIRKGTDKSVAGKGSSDTADRGAAL
jgi:hypothetical protein